MSFDIYVLPHAGHIIEAGLFIAILAVAQWHHYKDCKCRRKPTILRPKWKRTDSRDDFDRYTDE